MPQGIVAPSQTSVCGIQVDQIISSMLGNTGGNALRQITVRIDQGKSIAVRKVLQSHAFKQRGLAGPCFSDRIHMREPILSFDTKDAPIVSVINSSQKYNLT